MWKASCSFYRVKQNAVYSRWQECQRETTEVTWRPRQKFCSNAKLVMCYCAALEVQTCRYINVQPAPHVRYMWFHESHVSHQHDRLFLGKALECLYPFPKVVNILLKLKSFKKEGVTGAWGKTISSTSERQMVRMQKRDRRKTDQIEMDAQSCLLIPYVWKES